MNVIQELQSATELPDKYARRLLKISGLIWLVTIVAGLAVFDRYVNTPGAQAATALTRLEQVALPSTAGKSTIVMIVHPYCPCSRASIAQIDRLIARFPDRLTADFVFVTYAGVSTAWARSDLWRQASAIPGAHVSIDDRGKIASSLGAQTSGQAYVYNPAGELVFQGGLTSSRGEEGDSVGLAAASYAIESSKPSRTHPPVMGCPLLLHAGASNTCSGHE